MSETHWKKLINPDYLGAYSLDPGKDMVLTIRQVKKEMVTGADGKKEECIVCYWQEEQKPMILNVTNCKMIAKLLKTPYIERWAGHRIQIGAEVVSAFGEKVEALRVRKTLPEESKIPCEECGQFIQPAFNMSVTQLAAYTKKKYGKQLCAECAKEKKEAGAVD
ncbi:MAG: hypothetical protein II008_07650 [Oscillospiraceae bacterium]|nr:hypothetical protein [Oscillospiraceae bacterium]